MFARLLDSGRRGLSQLIHPQRFSVRFRDKVSLPIESCRGGYTRQPYCLLRYWRHSRKIRIEWHCVPIQAVVKEDIARAR